MLNYIYSIRHESKQMPDQTHLVNFGGCTTRLAAKRFLHYVAKLFGIVGLDLDEVMTTIGVTGIIQKTKTTWWCS